MEADTRFDGRVAVITGGGSGLGNEIARALGALGARVVLASRDESRLQSAAADLAARGIEALPVVTDVRDHHQTRRLVRETIEKLGRLDILVNNAAGNFVRPAERLPESAFSNIVDIVLNGTFNCSRAAGVEMMGRGGGVILNIVATYAWTGGPGTVHSAAAKAGVLALTRTLAVEWASRGVRVVAVAPGPFESRGAADRLWPTEEMREKVGRSIPLGRFATREEVARACLFLLSDDASYITGECLTVDGGGWLGRGLAGEGPGEIPIVRRRRGTDREDEPGA